MKHIYLLPSLFFFFLSCSTNEQTSNEEIKNEKKQEVFEEKETPFSIKEKATYDISQLDFDGGIIFSNYWDDKNGENVVLFTEDPGKQLFVYHYAIKDNSPQLLRKVSDFIKDCDWDYAFEFIKPSISATDLDKDNIGEITFAYRITCTSDVSPWELKLLTLENGDKYIIRGTTAISYGEENYGGDKTIDESFTNGPQAFLDHANKTWEVCIKETKMEM